MLVCPNCGSEYREGYEKCSDCAVDLILKDNVGDNLAPLQDEWIYMTNVLQEYEAIHIKSLLEESNIPVLIKSKGSGEYLKIVHGMTYHGFDLYVPKKKIEDAKELLNNIYIEDSKVEAFSSEANIGSKEYIKKRRVGIWILIFIFLGPGIIFLISSIFKSIMAFGK